MTLAVDRFLMIHRILGTSNKAILISLYMFKAENAHLQ